MNALIGVVSAETFVAVLTTLSELLDKAEKHCQERRMDPSELLNARLAPDMYSFHVQVLLACYFIRRAMEWRGWLAKSLRRARTPVGPRSRA